MKKNLLPIIIVVCIALSFGFMHSTSAVNEVILVRGYIYVGFANVNTVKIYRATAPVEIIEMEKTKSKEAFDENMSKIIEVVNKFTTQGYEVVSSTELGTNGVVIMDFTLKK
jgi:hypothetical protein